jgi:DNA repair exonuclease SbcCD ATPase subunit
MAELREVAERLYGLPLADFISARKAEASAASKDGDEDTAYRIAELRKPSVGAWLVNQLARNREAFVAEVLELGERLREAQEESDGEALRELGTDRRELVKRGVKEASTVAGDNGQKATSTVLTNVEETLRAALSDATAGQALRDGLLVKPLSPAGLGSVDLSDALALPELAGSEPTPSRRSTRPPRETKGATVTQLKPAKERAADAAKALAEATDEVESTKAGLDVAKRLQHDKKRELDALRDQVAEVEDELRDAQERAESLTYDLAAAERARKKAASALERAEARLKRKS